MRSSLSATLFLILAGIACTAFASPLKSNARDLEIRDSDQLTITWLVSPPFAHLHSRSLRPLSAASPDPPPSAPTSDDIAVIQIATSRSLLYGRGSPKDTRTHLFVGNLPSRVRWQDLKDLFSKAGTVLRADVSLGPDNRSRGYGTVLLATAEDGRRAIKMFNGYSWQTRVLEVRPGSS
ncbi:RNA-binding domain-containing protein [Gymnopus androsaceus JB14]|uniref:RNA-binding domain-containing protein n=1 Tax=Gymnopus androsaceus JB14 TaxID=1447944 RepID=A0A6A4GYX9_9AGAR|nr:RNA-binding domain-containing protein [Gymnopus androsaceus JB14]